MFLPQLAVSCLRSRLPPEHRLLSVLDHLLHVLLKLSPSRHIPVGSGSPAIIVGTVTDTSGSAATMPSRPMDMPAGSKDTGTIAVADMSGLTATGATKHKETSAAIRWRTLPVSGSLLSI